MRTTFYQQAGRVPPWLLLAAGGLLASPALAQAPATFALQASPPATSGSEPRYVVVADVNGDGKLDAVVTNSQSGTLGVLLGNGTGGFALQANPPATGGTFPNGVAIADVNGDGRPDVLVANNSGRLGVLLGNGAGGFTLQANPAQIGTGQNSPRDLMVADVNGDGRPDAVVASNVPGQVSVLLGNGSGGFVQASSTATGNISGQPFGPYLLALADVTKDGRPDVLAVNNDSPNTLAVLLNAGGGSFSLQPNSPATGGTSPSAPASIAVADVNGDGNPDALAPNGSTLGVLLGNGAGSFALQANPASTGASTSTYAVAVADVNGDGKLDALVPNGNGQLGVLLGNGAGGFALQANSPATGGSSYGSGSRIAVADVNGDGKPDVLVPNSNGTLGVLLNTTVAAPTLTSLSPTSGPVGASITLTGTNLTGATGVSFNGTAATTFAVVNSTTVTATVPTGATTGNVTVTTPGGTTGGVAFAVAAPTNNALAFDGSTDYVSGTNAQLPQGSAARTLEAWVNASNSGVGLVTYGTNATNQRAGISLIGNRLYYAGSSNDLLGNIVMAQGTWHHVAATFDGTTLKLYVDGVLDVSQAKIFATAGTGFLLGYTGNSASEFLNGRLDEVRIYNTALTQAQVQADMFSTSSALPGNQIAYYNFDQGTAGGTNTGLTSLPDQSGTGNTGTLNTFALTGPASNWVRSFPTITGLSPTSGAQGTSVALAGTNLLDATGFAFNGTAVAPFNAPASDLAATITVPAGATTGPVSVSSATLTKYNGPTFTVPAAADLVVTTTTTIPAGTYNSITVNSPGVGTLAGNVTVNSSVTVSSGATLNDGCAIIGGAGTFTLAAGGTLGICAAQGIAASGASGAVQVTGTRSFSTDASYVYNGTAAQSTGSGLPAQVRNLSTTNATAVTLAAPTSVAQVLTVGAAGNLVTTPAGTLTLLSSASGTALLVNSGPGVVSGTATVQRYIDPSKNAGSGYRHYAAPVSNTTVADLATSSFTPTLNDAYNTSATPGAVAPFPTVFGYDQALVNRTNSSPAFDKGFFSPASLATPLVPGRGYTVQIGASQLVDFVGTLTQAAVSVPVARNAAGTINADVAGWQFLGNPYASPLDFTKFSPDSDYPGLDASIYVQESSGPYTGSYRSYVNGMGTSPLIASSQGFFMRKTAPGPSTVTFRNSQRVTAFDAQSSFFRTAADPRPRVQLALRSASGPADAFYAYAEAGATTGFDSRYDAWKLTNASGLNLASVNASGESLSIDGRPAFTPATAIALAVGVPAAGTYTLAAADIANLPAGLNAYLRDAQTGQVTRLSAGTSYAFSVTSAEAQAAITGRFSLQFGSASPLATAPALAATEVSVYPNPAHGSFTVAVPAVADASQVTAQLCNALGQVVRQQTAALPAAGARLRVATEGLAAGVYVLRLTAGSAAIAKRVVVQ